MRKYLLLFLILLGVSLNIDSVKAENQAYIEATKNMNCANSYDIYFRDCKGKGFWTDNHVYIDNGNSDGSDSFQLIGIKFIYENKEYLQFVYYQNGVYHYPYTTYYGLNPEHYDLSSYSNLKGYYSSNSSSGSLYNIGCAASSTGNYSWGCYTNFYNQNTYQSGSDTYSAGYASTVPYFYTPTYTSPWSDYRMYIISSDFPIFASIEDFLFYLSEGIVPESTVGGSYLKVSKNDVDLDMTIPDYNVGTHNQYLKFMPKNDVPDTYNTKVSVNLFGSLSGGSISAVGGDYLMPVEPVIDNNGYIYIDFNIDEIFKKYLKEHHRITYAPNIMSYTVRTLYINFQYYDTDTCKYSITRRFTIYFDRKKFSVWTDVPFSDISLIGTDKYIQYSLDYYTITSLLAKECNQNISDDTDYVGIYESVEVGDFPEWSGEWADIIPYAFSVVEHIYKTFINQANGFKNMFASFFAFLPKEINYILLGSIAVCVILRIFGR